MGGGLMQLVAYGAQDIYLTGNPQITFFKVVYRRHTNFSMEAIQQTMNGASSASVGAGTSSVTISRNGDLVNRVFIEIANTDAFTDTSAENGTHYIIDNVVCEIGGQQIDKHYGHWLETWAELTQPNEVGQTALVTTLGGQAVAAADTINHNGTKFQRMTGSGGVTAGALVSATYYVPLQFWFCRNPGLALPLIALQYHEVKLNIAWSAVKAAAQSCSVWCDYIYLDTDERRRFAQVSHEYLIEQVQHQSYGDTNTSKDINFNHPVKELVWTGARDPGTLNPLALAGTYQLKLNGHDRFAARDFTYFTRCQVWSHHTGFGGINLRDSIGVYSFALKPEEHQPSGTCNFSRIDNAQLVQGTGAAVEVYAINYNVLRIMSGMGGLAYSN
jgi:hypothetical protein